MCRDRTGGRDVRRIVYTKEDIAIRVREIAAEITAYYPRDEDVLTAARELHGLERLDQIKYAVLERSGGRIGLHRFPDPGMSYLPGRC